MIRKLRTLISTVLCGCLALGFAACSGETNANGELEVLAADAQGYQLVIQERDEDNDILYAYYRYVGLKDENIRKSTTEVAIPDYHRGEHGGFPVKEIGEDAFYEYVYLQKVTLPDSIKVISNRAFYWCEDLVEINMPTSLLEIGDEAFSGCIDLAVPTLAETIVVGYNAFKDCGTHLDK